MNNRPGAHRAGLQSYKQRSARQPIVAHRPTRLAQRDHLGMSAGIGIANHPVIALADDFAAALDQRTHCHLAGRLGLVGQFQRPVHQSGFVLVPVQKASARQATSGQSSIRRSLGPEILTMTGPTNWPARSGQAFFSARSTK